MLLINKHEAIHKNSGHVLRTEDVCLTGHHRHPVMYTNIAKSEDANNTATTVFHNGEPLCHHQSVFSKSTGDEPGDHGGIRSGTTQGKAEFVTFSANVFIESNHAVRSGDLMMSNNRNTPPAPVR